jgi:hypothetical protein
MKKYVTRQDQNTFEHRTVKRVQKLGLHKHIAYRGQSIPRIATLAVTGIHPVKPTVLLNFKTIHYLYLIFVKPHITVYCYYPIL